MLAHTAKKVRFLYLDTGRESNLPLDIMRQMLYLFAVLLIIGWFFGVFVLSLGNLIHVLIVMALIAVLLGLTRGENIR